MGAAGKEQATLRFDVTHIGSVGGTKPVNRSLTYQDRAGTRLNFPDPQVTVRCPESIWPEPCPTPFSVQVDGCKDAVQATLSDTTLLSLGRLVQVDATVRQVCPGKEVTVILTETDPKGVEHRRGMKVVTIPAQAGTECRDVILRGIAFAVPETLDPAGTPHSICEPRNFYARAVANYTDGQAVRLEADAVVP